MRELRARWSSAITPLFLALQVLGSLTQPCKLLKALVVAALKRLVSEINTGPDHHISEALAPISKFSLVRSQSALVVVVRKTARSLVP
jgi:hypothetical protein